MREIKFRAWNQKHKIWHEPGLLSVCGDGEIDFGGATMIGATLEFYTGLKDKNRKEIYEGDVYRRFNYIYQVVWNNEMAGFRGLCIGRRNIRIGGYEKVNSSRTLIYELHTHDGVMEVIGNIHENPELLEVKTEI